MINRLRTLGPRWHLARSIARDRRGIAAVEFALIASLVVLLTLGAFDLGNALQQEIVLQRAVEAGSVYAALHQDATGTANAVKAALPSSYTGALVNTDKSCGCEDSNGTVTASGGCACPNGSALLRYMTVSVNMSFSPVLLAYVTHLGASNVVQYQ